ncbi:hypothetical protein [Nonomuraea jiangxiensis]|uniref:hypothetical protein n=1 Tax=Nonomuraea jiangxiensis TaxID=633440 RepID=UPI00115FCF49|nr:hypothetical protein [Nonomuraea jiangxiensis]
MPELVGLKFDGTRATFRYFRRAPYIEITGERGAGKTAVLESLKAGYSRRLPVGNADLGRPDFGNPGLGAYALDPVPNASPVTDLLYFINHELGVHVRRFGAPVEFPRLMYGLLAVTAWETTSPRELAAARSRLQEALSTSRKGPDSVAKLLAKVAGAVAGNAGVPAPLDAVVKTLVEAVGEALFTRDVRRDVLDWWERRAVRTGGDGLDQLCSLAMSFRARGENREKAEGHLTAALLDDAAAYYGWWREQNRAPRLLMLLDNAHTALGTSFVDLLLRAQSEAAEEDRPGRIVVLAASLRHTGDHPEIGAALPALTWKEPAAEPQDWLVRFRLAPLTFGNIQSMLRGFQYDHRPARLIERLSGGNARIADALARAAAHASGSPDGLKPEELLDVRDGRSDTTGRRLLEELLPDGRARKRLIFYAPALDEEAAEHLSGRFPPEDADGRRFQDTKRYLPDNFWSQPFWPELKGPFVRHRALRTLLVHELRTRTDGETWTALHEELRSFHAPEGFDTSASKVEYLHHTLALGDHATVSRALHQLLDHLDAGSWLAALNIVCAAPQPPAGLMMDRPASGEPCPGCLSTGEGIHNAIDVLVRDLWWQSAPLSLPDDKRIDRIELQLLLLAECRRGRAQSVFDHARRTWPERLRGWHQAPDLTIPAGEES